MVYYLLFKFKIVIILIILSNTIVRKTALTKQKGAFWKLECQLGITEDTDCPIHGGWSPWGPWSTCQGPCDDYGHRQRTRDCINPPPSKGGNPCTGSREQIETCYITNCTVEDFRNLVKGDASRSESLRQLEVVPVLLERCLQMECPFEAIQAALATDNTWQLNADSIWDSLLCVKHNIGCQLVGGWNTWGSWSSCSARCGHGLRWRLRRCDSPPPSSINLVCEGQPLQSEDCVGEMCATTSDGSSEFTGTWGNWGEWSVCSEKCAYGVQRRKRICFEATTPHVMEIWGTHCQGQHDELKMCKNLKCSVDGSWAGWGGWGACSQSCGSGRRSRVRSCTRPVPFGGGAPCSGLRMEVSSCYLMPCETYTHIVAVLNGDGFINYRVPKKRSTLLNFYIRFKSLSQHGSLLRRGGKNRPQIQVYLQMWHICVDVKGSASSCDLQQFCSISAITSETWHSAMVSVTTEFVFLRVDDTNNPLKRLFSCDPNLPEEELNIWIGEHFYGELQEVTLNFMPLNLIIEHDQNIPTASLLMPNSASNIAYERSTIEEAFLVLQEGQYVRVPCFENQEDWNIELKVKPSSQYGILLFLSDDNTDNWLMVYLKKMRLKLKVALNTFRSESSSSIDFVPNEWLDLRLSKKKDSNSVMANLNGGERLHVMIQEQDRKRREATETTREDYEKTFINEELITNEETKKPNIASFPICSNEFYVGGIPIELRNTLPEHLTQFSGVIASLSINGILKDLKKFDMEENVDGKVQVSSRTASISGSYHETVWGKSKMLNLTCLHARTKRSPHTAQWLYIDTDLSNAVSQKKIRAIDDGRVLKLEASAENDPRGFYTCRAQINKVTRNVVTYGVVGECCQSLSTLDITTAVAVCTTISLIILTLGWLIIEATYDLRNGFGFFRDQHLSPKEESEAICQFIDKNADMIGSASAVRIAKRRARCVAKQVECNKVYDNNHLLLKKKFKQSFMQKTVVKLSDHSTTPSDLDSLPDLPPAPSTEPYHEVYKCKFNFVSSPRREPEIESASAKLNYSTTDPSSPRVLCSRLLTTKSRCSTRRTTVPRRNNFSLDELPTTPKKITLSRTLNISPAHKILLKFQELKNND